MWKKTKLLTRRKIITFSAISLTGFFLPLNLPTQVNANFGLPFPNEPSLSTWYIRQWYGNTRWAFRQKRVLYSGGQGMHFGVDFFAPCGSPVIAIGDGVIAAVDGPYGAGPHNLVIRHSNNYASLYGHLQARATLRIGQAIKQGQEIGISGTNTVAGANCDIHPHLHLEIRSHDMSRAFNPVKLIAADWYALTLGMPGEGLAFEVDLANPARWQTIFDQPDVRFGGAVLNNYIRSYPGQL
jgi:murein DD-endopeptidase MepM/ murein hydrolase activator NlpD